MTRRAAVLGSPIGHSLSPSLHRAAYAALGLDWTYEAIEVTEPGLPAFLDGLDGSWAGLSLTMPLKRAVLPLLDEVDPVAEQVAAANTVVLRDGRRLGFNTDVEGMVRAVRQAAGTGSVADAAGTAGSIGSGGGPVAAGVTATVLGGGATARSALAALARLGAGAVAVYVRRLEAGEDLVGLGGALGLTVTARPWSAAGDGMDADLVVSTVPGGAADHLAATLPGTRGVLLDVAYAPWPTGLASAWGLRVASGRDLLLWQAVGQVGIMTGLDAPVAAMRAGLPAA